MADTKAPLRSPRRPGVIICFRLTVVASLLLVPLVLKYHGWASPAAREGGELIGVRAPSLELDRWMNSSSVEIEDLRGQVVLVRWWTDACPFCSSSARALNNWQRVYGDRGLQVIGVFHPKPPGEAPQARVQQAVDRFGFTFPTAVDPAWTALERWWLSHSPRGWTSVSFLLDKKGLIRYIHPGGEYHLEPGGPHQRDHASCHRDYREIERLIEQLLAE